jgi:hypothetical protein
VEAKAELDTARGLQDMPETRAAVAAGELSLAQAKQVVRTEAECPGSEAELLRVARSQSLKTLKDKARKRRLGAVDPDELHARQHRERFFRHWRTDLGMVGFAGELPPEVGLPLVNRLDAETDRLRRRARRDGNREAREAHAADALVQMAASGGGGKARSADLVIVCDRRALRRGHAHPGEPCHLVGGGPVPVSLVHELAEDAFIKAVIHDGTRIETVVHFGRHIKAELRTALELGAVPDFDGVSCIEVGCDRRFHRRIPSVVATPDCPRSCDASSSSPEGWRESTAEGEEGSIPAAHVARNEQLGSVSDRRCGPKNRQLLALRPEAGDPRGPSGVLPTGGRWASFDRSEVLVPGRATDHR